VERTQPQSTFSDTLAHEPLELTAALDRAGPKHGQQLSALLEDPRLAGVVDAKGRNARVVAIQAMLRLGFPWALHVTYEDLKFLESHGKKSTVGWMSAGVVMVAAIGLAIIGMMSIAITLLEPVHHPALQLGGGAAMMLYAAMAVAAPLTRRGRQSLQATGARGIAALGGLIALSLYTSDALLIVGAVMTAVVAFTAVSVSFAMPQTAGA
jgi:hypothetical protein